MKQVIIFLACLSWPCTSARGQGKAIAERQSIDSLNELAFTALRDGGDSVAFYAQAALSRAVTIKYPAGQAESLARLGTLAYKNKQFGEARQYYDRALELRISLEDKPGVASCYNLLGLLERKQGHYAEALKFFEAGLAAMQHEPAHSNTAAIYNNTAATYRLQCRYDRAIGALSRTMELYNDLPDDPTARLGKATVRMDIANIRQEHLGEYESARDSLHKSLAEFEAGNHREHAAKCRLMLGNNAYYRGALDEAMEYYRQASAQLGTDDRAITIKNTGRIYLDQRDYNLAYEAFIRARDSFLVTNNTQELAATHFELGNLEYERSRFEPAVEQYKQVLAYEPNPFLLGRVLYFLPRALDRLGRREEDALYTVQFNQLLATMDSSQTRMIFEQMMRYQSQRSRLQERIDRQKQKSEREMMGGGLAILVLLLFVALQQMRAHAQKRRLAEQREQLTHQQYENQMQKMELEKNYARLEGEEAMRRRIGRELHDRVGAMLTAVKLYFTGVDDEIGRLREENRRQYAKANQLLDDACDEVRRVSHELSSALLVNFGLKARLEDLAEKHQVPGKLDIELFTHGLQERLDAKLENNIDNIVHELVNNVSRHARARKISIQVNRFDDLVNILVEDDGQGFDVEEAKRKPGIGMKNIASRVNDLHGEIQIDSRIGKGTSISIDLPLV
jgi:two-component system NarL family sensor kinase